MERRLPLDLDGSNVLLPGNFIFLQRFPDDRFREHGG
jgi:hypothetical protein